jgi:plasmid maintenance system antidote protein VapI
MAIRLDKAFGGGAAWYQLQAAYDMAQALKRSDEIRVDPILAPAR